MYAALRRAVVFLPAIIALVITYAFLPLTVPGIDNSPDEAANRTFATEFAEHQRLWRPEPLDVVAPDLVHPRSVRFAQGVQVPVGFLGLPVLYGGIAMFAGVWSIPFFTPLLAALAALAWGGIVAQASDRRTGVIAGTLLAAHPAWWYVASRTLQPNLLFMALLIGALWFFTASPLKEVRRAIPAGMLLGLALAVRPSEAYWIALVIGAMLVILRDRRAWIDAMIAAACAGVMLVPFVITQVGLYGGIFATGYGSAIGSDVVGAATGGNAAKLLGPLQPYLFPLGFAPRLAIETFKTYGIVFFGWWSALVGVAALVAVVLAARRRLTVTRPVVAMLVAGIVLTMWLAVFYGSWSIQDNPDPNAVTIGASYIRYWLPVFAASTLPVAWLISRIVSALPRRRIGTLIAAIAVIGIVVTSGYQIFTSHEEGLLTVRANLERYMEERDTVLTLTEEDALIVVDRSDKVLYPHRSVVTPLRSDRTYAALPALAAEVPVYYFGITLPASDLAWLNTVKLPPLGLSIEPIRPFVDQTLYRFIRNEESQ